MFASGRARITSVACLATILALTALVGHPAAPAAMASPALQTATSVSIDPTGAQLACDAEMDVDVAIAGVEDLFGVDIKVSFDPALLEVVDANPTTPGVQVKQGDLPDVSGGQGLIQVNSVDTDSGTISYAAVRLNPAPAQSGDGTIATITFRGLAEGTSAVNLVSVILADESARSIDAELSNGEIAVDCDGSTPPGPPTSEPPPDNGHGGYPEEGDCEHAVKPGETVTGIAKMYGVDVRSIMVANKLKSPDLIFAGQILVIPGCKPVAGPPIHRPDPKPPVAKPPVAKPPVGKPPVAKPPVVKPPVAKPLPPKGDCAHHVVRPGETLNSIAYHYGASVDSLAHQNGIVNPDLIYAGQTILVCGGHYPQPMPAYPADPGYGHDMPGYGHDMPGYGYEKKPAPMPEYGYDKPAPAPEYGYGKPAPMPEYGYDDPGYGYGKKPGYGYGQCSYTHVVKPGENLYRIGMHYGVPPKVLAHANGLPNENLVYAGQSICIP